MKTIRTLGRAFAACLVAGLAVPVTCLAQAGVAESQQHLREAAEARRAGDDARAIRSLETARELNPASLYTRYNLALAHARSGDTERAIELLEDLVDARVDFGMADEPDLAVIRDEPRGRRLLERLRERTKVSANGSLRHEVDRIDLVAEGIAFDAAGGRLFFGSMRTGEVFVFDAAGNLSKFAEVARDGPLAAIGMTVDAGRGQLWVVASSFFLTEGFDDEAPTLSGVFGFDLDTGEARGTYLRDDVEFGFNDVTLAPDGTLYLSGGSLGRLVPGDGAAIELLSTSEPVFGSNGIVVTPDGQRLVTSAYPSGLAVVELTGGATRFLSAPEDLTLYGIDGLYLYEGDLVGVQNGARPWRLMRFRVNDDWTAVTAATTLEFGSPAIATTGAIEGERIHYLAQAPAVDDPPQHLDESLHEYLGRTLIVTVPLDPSP